MKTRYFTLVLLMLIALTSCDKGERERKKLLKPIAEESVESYTSTLDAIDWSTHNAPGPDLNDETNKPCFQSLMNFYRQMPDINVDKRRFNEILKVYEFSRLIQKPVDDGKFKDIEGADNEFLSHPVRDRILLKIDSGYSPEEFVDEVKGNGDLSAAEVDELKAMHAKFQEEVKRRRYVVGVGSKQFDHCSFVEHLSVRYNSIHIDKKEIWFSIKRHLIFQCNCEAGMGPQDIRYGYIQFESVLIANYEEKGLYNLKFTSTSTPEITGLNLICCRNANPEPDDEENEDENH